MKVIFISNYLTHHQLPFCREMYARLGEDFLFIATNVMEEERIKMGWQTPLSEYPFACFYDDDKKRYEKLLLDSEIVICGGTHFVYIEERVKAGKLTFRYFERLYKTGKIHAFRPGSYYRKLREHTRYQKSPVYLLCAGAYVPEDFHLFGAYPGKMYKWGYFPETKTYDLDTLMKRKTAGEILWTGRMIDWKHPQEALELARSLKEKEISFHMTMIGEGPMRAQLEESLLRCGLQQYVTILDFMQPDRVRDYMEKSCIYLMTSDREEGWGAVVNEAMNSGCLVIGALEAGSVPYLISNGKNGLYYCQGDIKCLTELVENALTFKCNTENNSIKIPEAEDKAGLLPDRRTKGRHQHIAETDSVEMIQKDNMAEVMGRNAYQTITENWNAAVAAERFLVLCEKLQANEAYFFEEGILSRAETLTMRKRKTIFRRELQKKHK